jgi:hypothetical protein
VAVTVTQEPYIVLDEDFSIVEVSELAMPVVGSFLGRNVWTCFPGSRGLYEAHCATARRTGAPVEFAQYYDGRVVRVKAVPRGARVTLFYEVVERLDVLTLEGLRASLDSALKKLGEAEEALWREHVRASLRLVAGGP